MVQKVIMNFDLSKACGPDYISVVIVKNCEPELSYILAELFSRLLEGFIGGPCISEYWGKVCSEKPPPC